MSIKPPCFRLTKTPSFLSILKTDNWQVRRIKTYLLAFAIALILLELISAPIEWLWPYPLGGNTVWNGDKSRRAVSLTFDDGPSQYTSEILDILVSYHVKATFFVIGSRAEEYPQVIKSMAIEGHEIGNHLFWFEAVRGVKKLYYPFPIDEVSKTQDLIESLTGAPPKYFRSPGGQMGRNLWNAVRKHNLLVVNGSFPFPSQKDSAMTQLETIKSSLRPGAIIILHDGNDHDPNSDLPKAVVDLLPELLDYLNKEGYQVVPLSENMSIYDSNSR